MPLIDTLTLKTDLLDGGMPEPQATAIVKALECRRRAVGYESGYCRRAHED